MPAYEPEVGPVPPNSDGMSSDGLAQGGPQFIVTHCGFIDDQLGIVLTSFGKAKGGHGWLPNKTTGGQYGNHKAIPHCPVSPCKDGRTQQNLSEGKQSVNPSQESCMHHFNRMTVVQVEIQFMSGHWDF